MGRPRTQDTVCAIEGCDRLTQAWNRCSTHYREWRRGLPYWPIEHGTHNAYHNLKCRCRDCSQANTRAHRGRYKRVGIGPTNLVVDVEVPLWERLSAYATKHQRSIRSVALEAVEQYLAVNE